MGQPRVEVLGIYHLTVTDELFREQFDILYSYPMSPNEHSAAERQCREQLESVVLIEILVSNRDDRFDVGQFTQPRIGEPRANWQVAWAEAYLTKDGETLIVERGADAPKVDPLRLAFFLHYWDPDQLLHSSYGELKCPVPQQMPERLKRLVPYEPVD